MIVSKLRLKYLSIYIAGSINMLLQRDRGWANEAHMHKGIQSEL